MQPRKQRNRKEKDSKREIAAFCTEKRKEGKVIYSQLFYNESMDGCESTLFLQRAFMNFAVKDVISSKSGSFVLSEYEAIFWRKEFEVTNRVNIDHMIFICWVSA